MARIPFVALQGGTAPVSAQPLRPADAQVDPSAGVAAAGAARGLALGAEITDRFLQARNAVAVSDAITDSTDQLDTLRQDLEKDPDYAGREGKFARRLTELRNEKIAGLIDPRARDDFYMRFNRAARSMQSQVRTAAREEESQVFRVKLGENLDTLANKVVLAKSPQEAEAFKLEADNAIKDAVRTGQVGGLQGRTLQRAYLGKVDAALASEMIRTNPGGAIAALGDPERFKYLDASQRVNLRAQAQQRSESLSAQARVELRGDIADLTTAMAQGQTVDPAEVANTIKRAGGAKSTMGANLQRTWDFYQRVQVETTDKSIPQLTAAIAKYSTGERTTHDGYTAPKTADGATMTELSITVTNPQLNGGRPTNIPSLWQGREVSEGEAVRRALASGRTFQSFDTIEAATVSAAARSEALGSQVVKPPSAEDLHMARVLKAARDRKVAQRDADPAAYALQNYPTIAEDLVRADQVANSGDETAAQDAPALRRRAWQAMEATQLAEGVPAHKVSLLTAAQSDALKAQLLTSEGQKRVDLVQSLQGQYGDRWPRVYNQVSGGKPMPADIQVIASLPPGANVPAVMVAEASKISDKQAGEVLGTQKVADIDKAVRAQAPAMAGTMASAPNGAEFLATYQSAAEKVARLLVIRGEATDVAAKRAMDLVFYDHWEVVDQVRVPKQGGQAIVPPDAVRATQRQVIDALPKMELTVPAGVGTTEAARKDALVRNVRSFGYWMTTADDKGMVLMAGPGIPVLTADGKPVMLGWDSVLASSGNRQAEWNLRTRYAPEGDYVDLGSDPGPGAADPFRLGGTTLDNTRRSRRQAPSSPTEGLAP